MTRDPIKYKDPEVFNPERFLTEEGELNDDEVSYAFGFGRRFVVSEISTWKIDVPYYSNRRLPQHLSR